MTQTFNKKELKKKSENLSDWYTDVILKAQLADYGPVKGTMVIRPYGYALCEKVQELFNTMIKSADVENAYFPLFIPMSLLEKEKDHVEGFSPELAIVTIGGGEKLKDPLVVRPTSETIMYEMYSKWVQSWRDLPILINQWNNVVRWEKRTYLFLRTSEFLWQEGHTVHETEEEAVKIVLSALDWYRQIYEDYYAIPVVLGVKSSSEKFAGAKRTYTLEALMPDGKALQGGTSHNLGQNFSKVFDIKFQSREGKMEYGWQTSWGLSTRSLGGLFTVHGDDSGLVLPPKIAPIQVVIMPIVKKDGNSELIHAYCGEIKEALDNGGIRSKFDKREEPSVGRRFNEWEVKGVPVRFEVGTQEYSDRTVTIARRDTGEKITVKRENMLVTVEKILKNIQESLFANAKKFQDEQTRIAENYEEFKNIMATTRGFIKAFWCESEDCEKKIKEETKATTRCLPLTNVIPDGVYPASSEDRESSSISEGLCVYCGKPSKHRWLFAQAY